MKNKTAEDNREKPDWTKAALEHRDTHDYQSITQASGLSFQAGASHGWDKAMEHQQRWISVEKELPEEMEEVIVGAEGKESRAATFIQNKFWAKGAIPLQIYDVTHWMPPPTPPPL